MIIIGLTGSIGSGKTTLADFLAKQVRHAGHWESWQLIAEIAHGLHTSGIAYPAADDMEGITAWLRPLPALVRQATNRDLPPAVTIIAPQKIAINPESFTKLLEHLQAVQADTHLQSLPLTATNKETFRPLLQWLGGYLITQTDDGLWYDELLKQIAAEPELELATIGGVRFPGESDRIQRAGGTVARIERPELAKRDVHDLTERQNAHIPVNTTVINNGSLRQLQACAERLLQDLRADRLAEIYKAASA